MRPWQIAACFLMLGVGCSARTVVRQNPGPHDKGIRYYRPKPYLLLQPTPAKDSAEVRNDRYVQMSLEYLPDFSEEYSITVRSGLGSNKTSVKLVDGWKLTEINQTLDSEFDENVNAVANLLKAAAPQGIVGVEGEQVQGPSMVVRATNVPLGYYESVISRGRDGKKRFYGWRYVGFYPFQACPAEGIGIECVDCHASRIYGLVFRDGVMTFKAIQEVAHHSNSDVYRVHTGEILPLPLTEEVLRSMEEQARAAVAVQLRAAGHIEVEVDEARPHIVFTLMADDAERMQGILRDYQDDFEKSLTRIIQETAGQPYSALIRIHPRASFCPNPRDISLAR